MAAPPEKKVKIDVAPEEKESLTISMVVEEGLMARFQRDQLSPIYRINGYPFHLGLQLCAPQRVSVYLKCDMSNEAELWKCTSTVTTPLLPYPKELVFCSWKRGVYSWEEEIGIFDLEIGSSVQVTISTVEDENSWRLRSHLDFSAPLDGIIVIGEEEKEIRVNKEFLASQSLYFDRLFFGDFKEKNMDKIPIGDVEYEEFDNIIKMVCGSFEASLTKKNVLRVLDLADRFELKIVEDMVVSYLLSNAYTIAQKLLISQERNLPSLKNLCLNDCSSAYEMKSIKNAPEYADLSDAMKVEILDRVFDLIR